MATPIDVGTRPALLGLALAALVAAGCGAGGGNGGAAGERGVITPTIDDILDDPSACLGQQVEVNGRVAEVVGPRSFLLTEVSDRAEEEAGRDTLLVVATQPLPDDVEHDGGAPLRPGDFLQVQGTVLALEDLQGNLATPEAIGFEGLPTIVAGEVAAGSEEAQEEAAAGANPCAEDPGENQEP